MTCICSLVCEASICGDMVVSSCSHFSPDQHFAFIQMECFEATDPESEICFGFLAEIVCMRPLLNVV